MPDLYLQPHQARNAEPTVYENLLGDTIERAFGSDVVTLEGLVEYLNDHGPQPQDKNLNWTTESLAAELKRLGND